MLPPDKHTDIDFYNTAKLCDLCDLTKLTYSMRRLGVVNVIAIGFFWLHAGIYGNELILTAVPINSTIIACIISFFVFQLPISIIMVEAATIFPTDGGVSQIIKYDYYFYPSIKLNKQMIQFFC